MRCLPPSDYHQMNQLLKSITCSELLKRVNGITSESSYSRSSSALHEAGHDESHAVPVIMTPICFDSSLGIVEACLALSANKISSAPVYDESEGGFIGMFDYKDLLSFILKLFPTDSSNETSDNQFDNLEFTDIVKSALSGKSNVRLKHVTNLSNKNPLVTILSSATVYEAVQLLNKNQVYRLVVFEKDVNGANSFVSVLSQSTVNALIASTFSTLKKEVKPFGEWDTGKKSIQELGLMGEKKMLTIPPNSTVFNAITLMNDNNVSSVPIAEDHKGILSIVGSISISDIREVLSAKGGFKRLFQNSQSFFSSLRINQGLERNGNDRVPLFVIHPQTSLIMAIEKMAATKAHRLWVVEGADTLVGVVSLTDVLRIIHSTAA